jgi:hypothetical protein
MQCTMEGTCLNFATHDTFRPDGAKALLPGTITYITAHGLNGKSSPDY